MTTRTRYQKEQKALVASLTEQLAQMQADLANLEAIGLTGDLKAIILREAIPATAYRLEVETAELAVVMPDMRFLARNRPVRFEVRTQTFPVSGRQAIHRVVDTKTNETIDDYASKAAAIAHCKQMNAEAK